MTIASSNVARETPALSAFGQIDSRNCRNSPACGTLVFWFSVGGAFASAGLSGGVGTDFGFVFVGAAAALSESKSASAVALATSPRLIFMRSGMTPIRTRRNPHEMYRPCAHRQDA